MIVTAEDILELRIAQINFMLERLRGEQRQLTERHRELVQRRVELQKKLDS